MESRLVGFAGGMSGGLVLIVAGLGLLPSAPTPAPAADNSVGVRLPADAAPPAKQVLTLIGREGTFIDWSKTIQKSQWHPGLITEALVMQDINSDIKPLAAEKWDVSKDGLTWTFHLRKGLQWSDGVPLTAKDFEFTIKRIANPDTGFDVAWYFNMIKNLKEANEGKAKLDEMGVTAVDATTLRLTLTEPTPYLPMILSDLYVVPSHIVSKVGDSWSTSPATAVSAGPFKLEKWERDRELVFVANPAYRGIRKPYLERIVYKIGRDETLFPGYLGGDMDAMPWIYEGPLSPSDVAKIRVRSQAQEGELYVAVLPDVVGGLRRRPDRVQGCPRSQGVCDGHRP